MFMATLATNQTISAPTRPARRAVEIMSVLRIFAGAISWISPKYTSRIFGLGRSEPDARTAVVSRLFGARDLALGLAVRHPDADVRRAALQTGVVVDSADVIANLIAVRAGLPKTSLLGIAAGASLFVGLGVAGLAGDRRP
jgi:hypothetical protein